MHREVDERDSLMHRDIDTLLGTVGDDLIRLATSPTSAIVGVLVR